MKNSILLLKKREVTRKAIGLFLFLFIFLFNSNSVLAQCSLIAEDLISASVDEDCQAVITVDAVLDGDLTSCPGGDFTVYIYDGLNLVTSGNPAVIPAGYVNTTLSAIVRDAISGNESNSCTVNVYDYMVPTIACFGYISDATGTIETAADSYNRAADGSNAITCVPAVAPFDDVRYDVLQLEVTANGMYNFELNGTAPVDGFFLAFYADDFDPLNACTNLVNTDFGPAPSIGVGLVTGQTYFLVTSMYSNATPGEFDYTFTVNNAADVHVAVPDCDYTFYSYEDIDQKVIIKGYDNCEAPDIVLVNQLVTVNNCQLNFPDEQLRLINRTYKAVDQANPANESSLLDLTIEVFKLPDPIYYTQIYGPNDFLVTNGNAISCDDDFESTVNGCCDETGFPVPGDVGGPLDPGVPYLEIDGVITWLLNPDLQNNLSASYIDMDLSTPNPDCVSKVLRMWTVTEWGCDERPPRIFFQEIEVADTAAPELICPANDVLTTNVNGTFENTTFGTVFCGASYTFPVPFTSDNCQTDLQWNINIINDNNIPIEFIPDVDFTNSTSTDLPLGLNTIIYDVNDGCGNSTSCSFTVHVQDYTPPVAICQQFTVVALTYDGEAEVPATSFDSGSYDDCQFDRVEVRRMDQGPDFFNFITVDCNDIGNDVVVIMRAYDIFGNYSDCMVNVVVQDKLDPVIECPGPVTVDCDYYFDMENLDAYFGAPVAYDNCQVEITTQVENNINECGEGTLVRYFTATDPDGRTDACSQTITFVNTHHFGCGPNNIYDPSNSYGDIEWPADNMNIVGCLDPYNFASDSPLHPNQSGFPILNEDVCDLAGPAIYQDEVYVANDNDLDAAGACFKVIRTWKVKDWCNRVNGVYATWTFDQVLVVNNYTLPEFSRIIPDTTVCTVDEVCVDGFIGLNLTTSDECTADEDMKWQFKIDYFNDNAIDVYDYESPVYNGNSLDASNDYAIGTHRILWIAWDQCGNTIYQEHLFTIQNCKKPTPICLVGLSTDLTQMANGPAATIYADFYNDNSYHTCDYPLAFSYSADYNDNERTYGCADIGFHTIEMWVTAFLPDGTITQDYCITEIEIQDNFDICPDNMQFVTVGGSVTNEFQQPLTGVSVELDGSEFGDQITDESGSFAFPEMIAGGSYDLHPTLNNNFSNGVSTLDLIHVQKHLLGLKSIDSPYKMIAADVNNDQKISASDLLDTRELILGVSQEFSNNKSWRFIKANYEFENEANPLTESYPESDQINNIQEDINTQFIAVKIGDITNDASLNGLPVVEPRNNKTLQLDLDAVQLNSNQVEIPVYANDFNQINGFQFTLNYDKNALVFTGIASGAINLGANNYYETESGTIAVSWSKAIALDIMDEVELFKMKFDVKKTSELQNVLNIGSELAKAEAYDADLNKMNVELNFRNLELEGEYTLYQNSPNPFSEITVINFFMKEAGLATISIYDLNGKVLKVIEGDFNMGTNAITVTKSDLPANGMLYYQLSTDNFSATRKMIFVK